jgi:hypothetical protein
VQASHPKGAEPAQSLAREAVQRDPKKIGRAADTEPRFPEALQKLCRTVEVSDLDISPADLERGVRVAPRPLDEPSLAGGFQGQAIGSRAQGSPIKNFQDIDLRQNLFHGSTGEVFTAIISEWMGQVDDSALGPNLGDDLGRGKPGGYPGAEVETDDVSLSGADFLSHDNLKRSKRLERKGTVDLVVVRDRHAGDPGLAALAYDGSERGRGIVGIPGVEVEISPQYDLTALAAM